jgi:probable O-glycosylation ligase (exosortase A-associated)
LTALETTADWWRPEPAAAPAAAVEAPESGRTAFAALLAFTGILIVAPQAWFPVLGSLRIALVAAAVAIVAELLDRAVHHRPRRRTPREFVLAFAIAGWAIVTLPLSYWPGGSVATLTDHFLKAMAFFWLIGTVITTQARLRQFLWLLVLSSIPLSITALQNYASGTFLITPDGAAPRIAGYAGGSGLAANPNDLALMINLLLPFAAALLAMERGLLQRAIAGGALLLGAAGVIVTFSRAGFLALAALGIVGLVALARRRPLALVAVVVLLAGGSAMLPPGYFDRLSTITNITSDRTGSAQGRWSDAVVAMEIAARNPLTGVGLDQNVLALNQERGPTWREVHNVYLQYAVDLGVPGLTLFLALFVTLLRTAGRVRRQARFAPVARPLGIAAGSVQAALVAFAVAAFFHPVAYQFYFFLVAGLAVAVQHVLQGMQPPVGTERA